MIAIVVIRRDSPAPQLFEAYPAEAIGNNPNDEAVRVSLAEALGHGDTISATVVTIGVPDAPLIARMQDWLSLPAAVAD
ncbi:hypothetical protein [Kutzneria buriramensis]|nr:hypothetical protein [Kutzneria buriramensis]